MHTSQPSSLIQGRQARVAATSTVNGHLTYLDDSLSARNLELHSGGARTQLEAEDEADDPGALAAVGCLHAIGTILESVSRHPQLFVQVEPTLVPIMRRMLTSDGQGMYSNTSIWLIFDIVSILFRIFLFPDKV